MEQKLNIAEILKNKPRDTKLYSMIHGKCSFEAVTCLVVERYNIYKNSFKVTDTKYWKPITRNQFNSLYQGVLIDLNDSKYHLEHNTNWDKEIKKLFIK